MDSLERVFVIGQGEVGQRLSDALERAGVDVARVRRREGWDACRDASRAGLRLLCMREHDLPAALDELRSLPRNELALVQNGFLEPLTGPLDDVTRGLIWFTSKGSFFQELKPSEFYGPAAGALGGALARGGLAVKTLDDRARSLCAMIEKGVWNGVVGLPLGVHEVTLGEYLDKHEDEWRALVDEGVAAAGAHYGVACEAQTAARTLLETTRALGWVTTSPKALAWRNGAVAWMGREHAVPTPTHDRLLRAAGYDPESSPASSARTP